MRIRRAWVALSHGSEIGGASSAWTRRSPCVIWNLPSKANAARRHHIPKQKRKLTNLRAYDASLRQRGSLTVWFTDEAITA
jgi:hypothetical protein